MLYTTIKALLLPPGGVILLLLLGFALVRGTLGRLFLLTGISLLLLMSTPELAGRLMASLETYPALTRDDLAGTPARGILILGSERYSGSEYGGDSVGARTLARLRYGAYLHRLTKLPVYVTGGSPAVEGKAVGTLMARVLAEDYGITAAGVEAQSGDTYENAMLSAPMLRRDGIGHVLLVTHAWHMPRAMEVFATTDLQVTAAPTDFVSRPPGDPLRLGDLLPSATALSQSYFGVHEWVGRAWYQIRAAGGPPGGTGSPLPAQSPAGL